MKLVQLGDVVEVRGGGTPSKSRPEFYTGDIPWVTPKDMKVWEIFDSIDKITPEAVANSSSNLIPENTILLVNRSGILKHTLPVGITRRPVAINQDIKALICSAQVHPEYLAHLVKAAEPTVLKWVRATTADNFPIQNLRELQIPLPPLEEQRRIAGILDQAGALRRLRTRALDKLNTLGQAIFHEMFGDPVANKQRWNSVKIQDASIHISDGNYAEKYPKADEFVEAGVPFIRANNIRNGTVVADDVRYITEQKHNLLRKGHLREGDVLITTRGQIGKLALVPSSFCGANINAQLVLMRCESREIKPEFLMFQLNQSSFQLRFAQVQTGVALQQLPVKRLKQLSIIIPSVRLQEDFSEKMKAITERSQTVSTSLLQFDSLFASLQHRAFRGEL